MKLEQNGFKEKDLQIAWKSAKHVQTTADIISFIRQVAVGSELVNHDARIRAAMDKVYGLTDWSITQKKWLKRIENQLLSSTVLGPSAEKAFDDNYYFKRQGGYKQIKKILITQKKWLKRIENQLLSSTVLGPSAEKAFDDNYYFKRQGGYKQIKKIFAKYADKIIYVLNENLYV